MVKFSAFRVVRFIFWKFFKLADVLAHKIPLVKPGKIHAFMSGRPNYKKLFNEKHCGKGAYFDPTLQIFGWQNVEVGENVLLSENVWINLNDLGGDTPSLVLGDNVHIGRGNYFSTATTINIGSYSFTGLNCNFLGCGHVISSPMQPYIASGITTGKPIFIGVNCWLTTSVTVMAGVCIGRGSVIGAGSTVLHDIPPFSIAVGNPCRVIKRFNFNLQRWMSISEWDDCYETYFPTEIDYLDALINDAGKTNLPLHAGSKDFGWL